MSTIDVIFLFMFLPAVLIASALKPKWRKYALLLLSCFFYACGSPAFFTLLVTAVMINVFLAYLLQKLIKKQLFSNIHIGIRDNF